MKTNAIIISFLFLTIIGCNKFEKTEPFKKEQLKALEPKKNPEKTAPEAEEDFCVTGVPESIVRADHVVKTNFKLIDAHHAEETALLENGDNVVIAIGGCEYHTLSFRFETSRFTNEPDDVAGWYANVNQIMSSSLAAWNDNLIKRGLMFLSSNREKNLNNGKLKYGEEIDFDSDEIRNFVVLDKVEKLSNGKVAVTIVFSRGPL